jgi:O-antigen ligase
MLFVLPITSMPIVEKILGSENVASPSIIFLALLVILWLIPYLLKKGEIQSLSIPLLIFFGCALLSTFAAFFINLPQFKDFSFLKSNFQSIATLIIGICFYLLVSSFPQKEDDLSRSLRVINWSGLVMLLWAAIQAISWFGFHKYPGWMFNFQGFFSARVLYHNRVTGFALEPSWLAHQLNMLYLPIWLASSVRRYSSHSFKLFSFSFENLLLFAGFITLILTLSRGGYIAFLLMLSVFVIQLNIKLINYLKNYWLKKRGKKDVITSQTKIFTVVLSLSLIIGYLLLLLSGLFILSKVDKRMKDIFNFSPNVKNPFLGYLNNLQVGERTVYWLTGWEIFNDHPVLGVGLGNAGFFFPEKMPSYGWTLVEVRQLIYRSDILLNIKNLWVRLLAETGIVGFSVFISWLIFLIANLKKYLNNSHKLVSVLAFVGLLVIIALPAEGFSVDSFAMPYFWISLGLMTANLRIQSETEFSKK